MFADLIPMRGKELIKNAFFKAILPSFEKEVSGAGEGRGGNPEQFK